VACRVRGVAFFCGFSSGKNEEMLITTENLGLHVISCDLSTDTSGNSSGNMLHRKGGKFTVQHGTEATEIREFIDFYREGGPTMLSCQFHVFEKLKALYSFDCGRQKLLRRLTYWC
jgi:hypothetical protein